MGGLFKPNGSKSSQITTVDPYGNDKYWDMVSGGFQDIMDKQGQTGPAYGGQLTTGYTNGQQASLDALKSFTGNDTLTSQVANGSYLDVANNPVYQKAIRDVTTQFGNNINSLNTKFSPWTSSSMRNSAASDLSKSFTTGLSDAWANQYNTEMNRALNAQNTMQGYVKDVANAESGKQANEQAGLDANYKEWLRQQGVADTSINNFLQAAALLRAPEQDTNSKTKQTTSFLGK